MGSTTAYNSMVTACITFLLLSYAIPIIAFLIKGRNTIKHGPFWLGKIGLFANIVTLCWTLFALVFFSFPSTMPVDKDTMNYSSVVIFGLVVYAIIYWFARANKRFARSHVDKDDLDLVGLQDFNPKQD
jgi:choline transport protein